MKDHNNDKVNPKPGLTVDLTGALDFKDIKGNEEIKRALEIAAAGFHHILLIGPPGCGKTTLAKSIYSILPEMDEFEKSFITKTYYEKGLLKIRERLNQRPFRSITPVNTLQVPTEKEKEKNGFHIMEAEIDLAEKGMVLADNLHDVEKSFQDKLYRYVFTDLREFMLTATSLPITSPAAISNDLLDCIDIRISINSLPGNGATTNGSTTFLEMEDSNAVKKRVKKAWEIQVDRYSDFVSMRTKILNSKLNNKRLNIFCNFTEGCDEMLLEAILSNGLTPMSRYKIIKISRTIADLAGNLFIHPQHLHEAIQCRNLQWEKQVIKTNHKRKEEIYKRPVRK